ncbi:hypothetical protein D9M69_474450 [compost metagenome]
MPGCDVQVRFVSGQVIPIGLGHVEGSIENTNCLVMVFKYLRTDRRNLFLLQRICVHVLLEFLRLSRVIGSAEISVSKFSKWYVLAVNVYQSIIFKSCFAYALCFFRSLTFRFTFDFYGVLFGLFRFIVVIFIFKCLRVF